MAALSRRGLLGGLGALGLGGVAAALASPARAPADRPALILLWLDGGPSQLETFDPHPGARIAAGTGAIPTAAPGVSLATGFEQLAEQMHDVALVRSLVSNEGDHERAIYQLETGHRPTPALTHPSIGAILCDQLGCDPIAAEQLEIPGHVSILPGRWPARGGFLGARLDAFQIGDPGGRLPDVELRVDVDRAAQRYADLEIVEQSFCEGREAQAAATRHRETIAAARTMMSSAQLRAFDVSEEPRAVRRRYGDTPFGRGCLAARRLIEIGVACVEVTLSGWDTHVDNHQTTRELVGVLDPAFASLLGDLRERELLRRTVVVCGGEFGRTPAINRLDGRDHWPHGFSFALAGAGLRGGTVVGATDPEGGREVADPRTIADVHATVLAALGLDPKTVLVTPAARPIELSEGAPIRELLPG